jgi:hypothetical protein
VTGNGHDPAYTDLDAVIARTAPPRFIRFAGRIDPRNITLYELSDVGEVLGVTPLELTRLGDTDWRSLKLQQALVWVILRREEPALTWEEARTFALELPADDPDRPTPASAGASRPPGHASSSTPPAAPGSRRAKRAR